jgi:hypothetical protein
MTISRRRYVLAAWLVLVCAVGMPAYAFRCGTRVITRGDHATKLLQYCGQPVSVDTRYAERSVTTRLGRVIPGYREEVKIEEWVYNFGPNQLLRIVRLENDIVANIDTRGYGY